MQIIAEIHREQGINLHGNIIHRIAVRAVIRRERELLMVYSANVGDYKFPGGGVDAGETHEQALHREVQEECGASLLSMNGELGAVVEYKKPIESGFDVLKMTSHYYFCMVANQPFGALKLDGYESNLGFTPLWITVDQALHENTRLLTSAVPPTWLSREIFVLDYLKRSLFASQRSNT
jgi:8-oxo-dGTP pyrophosphatase MutT (NUDIX family)